MCVHFLMLFYQPQSCVSAAAHTKLCLSACLLPFTTIHSHRWKNKSTANMPSLIFQMQSPHFGISFASVSLSLNVFGACWHGKNTAVGWQGTAASIFWELAVTVLSLPPYLYICVYIQTLGTPYNTPSKITSKVHHHRLFHTVSSRVGQYIFSDQCWIHRKSGSISFMIWQIFIT